PQLKTFINVADEINTISSTVAPLANTIEVLNSTVLVQAAALSDLRLLVAELNGMILQQDEIIQQLTASAQLNYSRVKEETAASAAAVTNITDALSVSEDKITSLESSAAAAESNVSALAAAVKGLVTPSVVSAAAGLRSADVSWALHTAVVTAEP